MEEPWTLVVIVLSAGMVSCGLLFIIIKCCVCSYRGMKKTRQDRLRQLRLDYSGFSVPRTINVIDDGAQCQQQQQGDDTCNIHDDVFQQVEQQAVGEVNDTAQSCAVTVTTDQAT